MSSIVAIAEGTLALQFGLAGLRVEQPDTENNVEQLLDAMLDAPDACALIIVQDKFRRGFSEWFTERLRRRKGHPLVVFCPEYADDSMDPNAYITAILKPALGFELRLE